MLLILWPRAFASAHVLQQEKHVSFSKTYFLFFAGCMPYTSGSGCEDDRNSTGCTACQRQCVDSSPLNSALMVDGDKNGFLDDSTNITAAMMLEIITNGPISTCFDIYEDFFTFFRKNPKGVYVESPARVIAGRHCAKIIGWGSSLESVGNSKQLVPWWIVANSWADSWGDNGFFRYRRGTNLGGFEGSDVYTGCVEGSGSRCVLTFKPREKRSTDAISGSSRSYGGGWSVVDLTQVDQDLSRLALHHMVQRLSLSSNNRVELVSVEKQVVAGINYRLLFSIGGHRHEIKIFRDLKDDLSVLTMTRL